MHAMHGDLSPSRASLISCVSLRVPRPNEERADLLADLLEVADTVASMERESTVECHQI